MGELLRLRTVRRSAKRWESTFNRARLSQGELRALDAAINLLRWSKLPLPGDIKAVLPPVLTTGCYSHRVDGTSLRVVYRFDDAHGTLDLVSLHRIYV